MASYRRLVAQAPDPRTALALLDEMHAAGLSFDAEAALLALRRCTLPQGGAQQHLHLRDGLRLLRRLTTTTTPAAAALSPVTHAAYALALAGCVRAMDVDGGQRQHQRRLEVGVLASMRRQGVKPGVGVYQEVARACLEPKRGAEGRERAVGVLRAVLAMEPHAGVGGEEEQGPQQGQQQQGQQRLAVRCRDEGEAAWVQAVMAATSRTQGASSVDDALALLAGGLGACANGESAAAATTNNSAPAFACNLVLAACIRSGRWAEAAAVDELMRGLGAPPDAWAVNSLLARVLTDDDGGGQVVGGKGLAASRLLQGLLAVHLSLTPSASAYRALLKRGGCDALLDLLAAMQRTRGPGAVPTYAYRLLLRALDGEGRLVEEGLPLVAHAHA